jgi:ABC-type sugar transport system substrate-binding protein
MKKRVLATLLAGLMVIGSMTGCTKAGETTSAGTDKGKEDGKIKIAVLPKMKGENYWDACQTGAEDAIKELQDAGVDVEMLYDGPPQDQATNQKQVDLLEGWIAQGVDAVAVGCVDASAISPTLMKAREKGIKIVTFDSDSEADARDLFINQASYEGVAEALVENAAAQLKEKGYGPDHPANVAIMGQTKTDTNVEAWNSNVQKLIETEEYNWMKLQNKDSDIYYPGADEVEVQTQAGTLISRMGKGENKIQCAFGITSMTAPALASQYEAATNKPDADEIVLTGVATPNALKSYILNDENPFKTGVLWNSMDLGYLAVQAAYQLVNGDVAADASEIATDRLGSSLITDGEVLLGDPLVITKDNVEDFDY